MAGIRYWRENALLTQQQMADKFEIPKRTIENWEQGSRTPALWAEKLIVEKLMQITQEVYTHRAEVRISHMKSDTDGNRPCIKWVVIQQNGYNEDIFPCKDMYDAIERAKSGDQIACLITNKGHADYYEDRDGNIHPNYDGFVKS